MYWNIIYCFIAIITLWESDYYPYFTEMLENGFTKNIIFKHWKIYFCLKTAFGCFSLEYFYFREVTEVIKEVSWNYSELLL